MIVFGLVWINSTGKESSHAYDKTEKDNYISSEKKNHFEKDGLEDKNENTSTDSTALYGNSAGDKEEPDMYSVRISSKPELIIKHSAYILSFNEDNNEPNWVGWQLEDYETYGTLRRRNEFLPDPDVPYTHRVLPSDYKGSGYDRGHNAPSADMKFSAVSMKECFYMSNICPQTHNLNAGAWEKLEKSCRYWARKFGRIRIVCGPLFSGRKKYIGDKHMIRVPSAFFKCIYAEAKDRPQTIAFIIPNDEEKHIFYDCAVSVDEAERISGFDFFPSLPDNIENRIERTYNRKYWQ